MNPQGVGGGAFQSNADMGGNSFSDSGNIVHMQSGWGNNPNYLTPAYDAPYRPAYQGPNPYAAYGNMGFMKSVNNLINPFSTNNYWGNPISNNQSAFNSVGTGVVDKGVSITQGFIAPAVIHATSLAMFGNSSAALGKGLGQGLGMGARSSSVLGFGARFGLPVLGGMVVLEAAEQAVFQPYIRSRQMMDMVSDNFAGITFSGNTGNPISGRGMSQRDSARVGSKIDAMGIQDMSFNASQYGGIASMGMRSGLFDDVSNSSDMVKRVSSIAAQIKTIVAISKDPNIQSAIEDLAKLRLGGASVSGGAGSAAIGAYGAIGTNASIAGASVQRVMNTVGIQGQYMYQMNGITPYLGQIAASSAFAGFASAERLGILSTSKLARMGGREGATQSALAAQLGGVDTPYNVMGLANQFFGGNGTRGVVNTVSAFGSMASNNPLSMQGNMMLHGGTMKSAQLGGPGGVQKLEKDAVDYLRSIGREAGPGGYDPGEVAQVMSSMGLSSEMIGSYMSLRATQTDGRYIEQSQKASNATHLENISQIIDREMLWGGLLGRSAATAVRAAKTAKSVVAESIAYPFTTMGGEIADSIASFWYGAQFDGTLDKYNIEAGATGVNMGRALESLIMSKGGDTQAMGSDEHAVLKMINRSARRTGAQGDMARKMLSKGLDSKEGRKLLTQFLEGQNNSIARRVLNSFGSSSDMLDSIASAARGNVDFSEEQNGKVSSLSTMAAAVHLKGGSGLGLEIDDILNDPMYAELSNSLSGMSKSEKIDRVRALTKENLRGRGMTLGTGSVDAINAVLGELKSFDSTNAERQRNSSSEVNYKSFQETTNKLYDASTKLLEYANSVGGGSDSMLPRAFSGRSEFGFQRPTGSPSR